jgi:chaperonin GroEL (HSP60 family)
VKRVVRFCLRLILNSSEHIIPGGGGIEISLFKELNNQEDTIIQNLSKMFLIVPKLLLQSCGRNPYRDLKELKDNPSNEILGVNVTERRIENTLKSGIIDFTDSKLSIIDLSFETILMILKIDQIIFCGQE